MAQEFHASTAELLVSAVEAVVVRGAPADESFVAEFCDVVETQALEALALAVDLGFLKRVDSTYELATPLGRLLATPMEDSKAAILRAFLESYEPFVLFRRRIAASSLSDAARQVKVTLDLTAHREHIKDTLISLGTYAGALVTDGGGRYRPAETAMDTAVQAIESSISTESAAEATVRLLLTEATADRLSRASIILPIARALRHAASGNPRESVLNAGNAVETFLIDLADEIGVEIGNATGIASKAQRFRTEGPQARLPKKLLTMANFLSDVRNAADHGGDLDEGRPWVIQITTGNEYPLISCSFICAVRQFYDGGDLII